jgi:hypothetical protein
MMRRGIKFDWGRIQYKVFRAIVLGEQPLDTLAQVYVCLTSFVEERRPLRRVVSFQNFDEDFAFAHDWHLA